ncbi:hypothetical protein [Allomuricauda sp. M10]|uniref:hypothetical protein n=1 Tax=Allomuricauda sp. M10 TaxID=2683292 RepID=UPI001D18C089|nr:hypothetical protein [Muricauda sp. M10]
MDIEQFKKYRTENNVVHLPIKMDDEELIKLVPNELPPLPKIDFNIDPNYVFREHFLKLAFEAEESLVKLVLKEYLKREPVLTDAQRCTKIEHVDFPGRYILAYDHVQLGMIRQEMNGFVFQGGETTFY